MLKLYMRWGCQYCIRAMLQAALIPAQEIELVVLNKQSDRDIFYETNHGISPFMPVLEQSDGNLMQESEDIITYLQSLAGASLPQKPIYSEAEIRGLRDLLVELRFALQYYYKLHYHQSILHKAEIAPFPGSAVNAVQEKCDTLNNLLSKRFDNPDKLTINGISSDDFVIFAELPLLHDMRTYAKFTFGTRVQAYISEMLRLCSHLKGFDHLVPQE